MSDTLRAMMSVYDKRGLEELGRGLVALGWELIASGGTADRLRQAELPVTNVSTVTGAPQMIGGRVKTLHPAIHGGILAKPTAADFAEIAALGIQPIDLVVANLYPFQATVAQKGATLSEAIEQIDIGGVALLRAAAKNFARVTVVCDPTDYDVVLRNMKEDTLSLSLRHELAIKAFVHTRDYDTAIVEYLKQMLTTQGTLLR